MLLVSPCYSEIIASSNFYQFIYLRDTKVLKNTKLNYIGIIVTVFVAFVMLYSVYLLSQLLLLFF